MISSPRFNETKREVEDGWTLLDVLHAHKVLDVYDQLEAKAYEK